MLYYILQKNSQDIWNKLYELGFKRTDDRDLHILLKCKAIYADVFHKTFVCTYDEQLSTKEKQKALDCSQNEELFFKSLKFELNELS